jgi:hypothetical protein
MGVKKQNDLGLRSGIKVFWILLAISLFEVVLWSFCLFPCQAAAGYTDVAKAYYQRETVNLKSTTGQTVRVPTPSIDFRSLELALKAESAWTQRALASLLAAAPERPLKLWSQKFTAQSQSFTENLLQPDGEGSIEGIVVAC